MNKTRINIFLDKQVILRLKTQAMLRNISIQDLANEMLNKYLPKSITIDSASEVRPNKVVARS